MPYKNPIDKRIWAKTYNPQWKKKNPEKYKEGQKRYKMTHPEKYKKDRDYTKKWRKEHPELWKQQQKRQNVRRRGCKNGFHTLDEWENMKKEYNYCCARCGMQEPFTDQWYQKLTEDHIIPLSKNGTNYIDNIQPLCHRCNCVKSDKT